MAFKLKIGTEFCASFQLPGGDAAWLERIEHVFTLPNNWSVEAQYKYIAKYLRDIVVHPYRNLVDYEDQVDVVRRALDFSSDTVIQLKSGFELCVPCNEYEIVIILSEEGP